MHSQWIHAPLLLAASLGAQSLAHFDRCRAPQATSSPRGRVCVLVERRVWKLGGNELRRALDRFAGDLEHDGYRARIETVTLAKSAGHRGGSYVLAIRRHLIKLWHSPLGLAGAVLVGHFPDARLVRTVNWHKRGDLVLHRNQKNQTRYRTSYLRRVPELVADRCDLVLADLNGNWDKVYREPRQTLATLYAVFPDGVPEHGGVPTDHEAGSLSFADFFHIDDGRVHLEHGRIAIDDATRDAETTPADRRADNPIARPELSISRIDARGVAWSPRSVFRGRRLLDERGHPRTLAKVGGKRPSFFDLWKPDPKLEVQLLANYFARNHAYRTTRRGDAFRPASFAWRLGSGMRALRRAAPEWTDFHEAGYDVRQHADLAALIAWLTRPATLRFVAGHSNGRFTGFQATSPERLRDALHGEILAWRWNATLGSLEPATAAHAKSGRADFAFYRTLYANSVLPATGYLLLHVGCEVLSPPNARRLPFRDPRYGARQNAESQLFFTPALTIVGRSKVFYDAPRGFSEALREGKNIGDALRRYFELESQAKTWQTVGGDIGRKRCYFWATLGDWTLRLRQ